MATCDYGFGFFKYETSVKAGTECLTGLLYHDEQWASLIVIAPPTKRARWFWFQIVLQIEMNAKHEIIF